MIHFRPSKVSTALPLVIDGIGNGRIIVLAAAWPLILDLQPSELVQN